jgi:sulfate transport system permease protein
MAATPDLTASEIPPTGKHARKSSPAVRARHRRVLPGFGLSLGFTLTYLGLIVLIPLAATFVKTSGMGWGEFWSAVTSPRVIASYELTFGASGLAALFNVPFGALLAWVLVRYEFPGRRLVDSLVDLPFALPTAVAGIALTSLYVKTGWFGRVLEPLGIHVAHAPLGVWVALVFIGLPFVVRTVQPILEELEPEIEEAAATLGASRLQTIVRVVIPALLPAVITGFALAFARAIGEYGSIVFISGNLPYKTEITPQLIIIKLEENDYAGATALAVVMMIGSFALLMLIQLVQRVYGRRTRG